MKGSKSLVVCEEGRDKTYSNYFKAHRSSDGQIRRGIVDDVIMLKSSRTL